MSSSSSLLLCVNKLCAGYGNSQVLFDVNLNINEGEVVSLLGRNGMGKTTLLNTIVGVLPLMSGNIQFGGRSINKLHTDQIARLGIAIVPEGRRCFPNLTVMEHLTAFTAYRNPSLSVKWDADKVMDIFPRLRERYRHMCNQLSGGEQQMLAIGRALVTNPRLLVLDEATEGLAPLVREEIWQCIEYLRSMGQTILVVDKYVDRLVKIANKHFILEKGIIVWEGTSSQLDADRSVWTNYLGV